MKGISHIQPRSIYYLYFFQIYSVNAVHRKISIIAQLLTQIKFYIHEKVYYSLLDIYVNQIKVDIIPSQRLTYQFVCRRKGQQTV